MVEEKQKETKVIYKRGGIGFLSILTLIFVVAKITGFLSWSWWLVFLPVILPFAFMLLVFLVVLIMFIVDEYLK